MKNLLLLLGILTLASCSPEGQCPYADEITYDAYGNVVECTYYQDNITDNPKDNYIEIENRSSYSSKVVYVIHDDHGCLWKVFVPAGESVYINVGNERCSRFEVSDDGCGGYGSYIGSDCHVRV